MYWLFARPQINVVYKHGTRRQKPQYVYESFSLDALSCITEPFHAVNIQTWIWGRYTCSGIQTLYTKPRNRIYPCLKNWSVISV